MEDADDHSVVLDGLLVQIVNGLERLGGVVRVSDEIGHAVKDHTVYSAAFVTGTLQL